LILVGGFGNSEYLQRMLMHWCKDNGIKNLICPPDW
jgi:tRNA A37 threonylcarbamoyltransferase TsaD